MMRNMLEQSVIYQDILERGIQKGEVRGFQKGELRGLQHEQSLLLRMLERRLGKVPRTARKQILQLDFEQLGELGIALLDFTTAKELTTWLKQQTRPR